MDTIQTAKKALESKDHKEGPIATAIEEQTSKIPSDVFLWAAIGSMGISLALRIMGKKDNSQFVGQWAAPFLLLGVYNKMVKQAGHDKETDVKR